jgi:hypothetical protein
MFAKPQPARYRTTLLLFSANNPRHVTNHSLQIATSIPIENIWGRLNRAARSDKNLSQVLKNMDSQSEKSTVQSGSLHFVSICPGSLQALRSKKRLVLIRKITNPPSPACRHYFQVVRRAPLHAPRTLEPSPTCPALAILTRDVFKGGGRPPASVARNGDSSPAVFTSLIRQNCDPGTRKGRPS